MPAGTVCGRFGVIQWTFRASVHVGCSVCPSSVKLAHLVQSCLGDLAALLDGHQDLCFEDVGLARLLAQAEQSCDRMGIQGYP